MVWPVPCSEGPGAAVPALWLVDLAVPPAARDIGALSQAERDRAARFRDPAHGRRYLAAHCALRRLIAEATGIAPAAQLHSCPGGLGKPVVAADPPVHFSLSHADGFALIGLSRIAPIGVDCEPIRPIDDATALAERYFTAGECAALAAAPAAAADATFLAGWTAKEACVKAIGLGLSLDTASFASGVSGGERRVWLPSGGRMLPARVATIRPAAGLIGAWAMLDPPTCAGPRPDGSMIAPTPNCEWA